jgi:hypothetical protein
MPKYNIKVSFCGKPFSISGVEAKNRDEARAKIHDLIKFDSIKSEPIESDFDNAIALMNMIFGSGKKKK